MSNKAKLTRFAIDTIPKVSPLLEVPSASPQVGIHDRGFDKLTSAEKLNDSSYRTLVYQSYPDEPTCACEPIHEEFDTVKSPGNLLVCRSGCNSVCCSRMRQSRVASSCRCNANKDDKVAPFIATYCVGNKGDNSGYNGDEMRKHADHNGNYCCVRNRLRGGGEGGEGRGEQGMYAQSGKVSGTVVRWLEDGWNGRRNDCVGRRRLDGGGGGGGVEYAERYPRYKDPEQGTRKGCSKTSPIKQAEDSNFNPSSLYRGQVNPRLLTGNLDAPVAASCCCPGKETFRNATRNRGDPDIHGQKPLPVIDSLVKTFQETQEFVDSLGRVPGLPGLGLMDPAESPYFSRIRRRETDLQASKTAVQSAGHSLLHNPQCTGPCNAPNLRSPDGGWTGSSIGGSAFTTGVPGRGGVVREAVPAMPEPGLTFAEEKLRMKDDKDKLKETNLDGVLPADAEPSPCGDAMCKSKRRKKEVPEEPATAETEDETTKKIVTSGNTTNRKVSKSTSKMKEIHKFRSSRKGSDILARGADQRKSSGKAGRKMASFVYSAGDTWTGESYGHKKCVQERRRIPGNMGWLWNLNETVGRLKPRRAGWRPGAIGRQVREVLREARAHSLRKARSAISKSSRSSTPRSRSGSATSKGKQTKTEDDRRSVKRKQMKKKGAGKEQTEPPPTLYIHRKDGTYYVTMYPIKQDTMDVPKLEEPMKPLQFKIARNRDDASIASSSTASDMEIEFSPPAAVNRYRKKPNVIHVNTQVKQQEIIEAFKKTDGVKVITVKKRAKIGKK